MIFKMKRLRTLIGLWAVVLITVLHATPSSGDEGTINENPLTVTAKFVPERTTPGGTTELRLEMRLAEGHHAYRDRFKLAIESPEGLKIDASRVAPLVKFKDSVSGTLKDGIENQATLRATVEVPISFPDGSEPAHVRFTYQACTDDHCLFPKTIALEVPLTIGSTGATGGATIGKAADRAPESDFAKAMGHGLFSALIFVFIAGFLTSLTPCIYPMIPITLAILGAQAQHEVGRTPRGLRRWRGLALSCVYVLGIATTYSALGVAAASTGALFGAALGNVYVVSAIALVFVSMGLSMYGLFELRLPGAWLNRLGSTRTQEGFLGAYLTGLITGAVASPCVGPVLVFVLAYIAQTQDRLLGFLLLFTFACGMGVLFIVLGAFSHLAKRVPKSGPWMEAVKFTFGTTMVGMALFYVRPVYPAWLFHALLALALVMISSVYGAFETGARLTSGASRLRKGLMLATFFVGTGLAVAATLDFFGAARVESPPSGTAALEWKPFTDEALARARASGQPVVLDFTAGWCAACKELETLTFSDARVRELSRTFLLLTVDATETSSALASLQARFKVAGLPTLIFFDGQGQRRDDLTLTGFENAERFLVRMRGAAGSGL